jgi:hypothetical protein
MFGELFKRRHAKVDKRSSKSLTPGGMSMKSRSSRRQNRWGGPYHCWGISGVLALAVTGLTPTIASAYTAAGDRNFPAQLLLPQIGPTDSLWVPIMTQPMYPELNNGQTRGTSVTGTYSKLITERLGIQLEYGASTIDRLGASSVTGPQNFHALLQYEPFLDLEHEFLLSIQVDHEYGGTGTQSAGISEKHGATTPGLTFGKGLGDLPIGYWRPLAITGFAGYQVGNGSRASMATGGFSVQYSMPYLLSKVGNVEMPAFLRGMTPMTEVTFNGQQKMNFVAPGFSYSRGKGWELGIEALIPTNRATGRGIGVIAQLLVQLDYLLPESVVGRPIFVPTDLP